MFRAKRRSVSERGLRTRVKVAWLLPICALAAFTMTSILVQARGGARGHSYPRRGQALAFIENFKEPVSKWVVTPSGRGWANSTRLWPDDSVGIWIWYTSRTNSVYRNLFGLRTVLRCTHTCTIDSFHDAKYEAGWRPTELFEQEFGVDWMAMRHPEFRARVLPSIEKAIAADVADFAGEEAVAPPVVMAGFVGTGVLVVESDVAASRWDVIPKLFSLTIPLWIVLSVCVVIADFISRERNAQRWVAMKCPKCGYERQRDRDECPECGLVYERPSYVMWDPTEEAACEGASRDKT